MIYNLPSFALQELREMYVCVYVREIYNYVYVFGGLYKNKIWKNT